jgi:methionine salvage enolase-phosphatase E1
MRNVILVLIFLIFTFSINVAFYYVSPNYREFLRKHFNESETVIELENAKNEDIKNLEDKIEEKIDEDLSIIKPSEKNDEIFKNGNDNKVEIKPEITL